MAQRSSAPRPATRPASPPSPVRSTTLGSSPSSGSAASSSPELRAQLAAEAFGAVAAYHAEIAAYLNQLSGTIFPKRLAMVLEKVADLRYGENPHQPAAFYRETTHRSATLADSTQLHGDRPSFNNLLDLDAAYRTAQDFTGPTVAIAKHTDPVGVASADELVEAYRKALETDPVASFGGIVGVNREMDGPTARAIAQNSYEAVVAPGYDRAAIGILRQKPGLEILAVPAEPTEGMRDYGIANLDFKRVGGGLLVETLDTLGIDRGTAPGRHEAPADARGADRPPVRLAHRPPRPVQRDRPRQEWRDRRDRRRPGEPPGLGRDRAPARGRSLAPERHGERRLLPVPGRHPDRGPGRRDRHHPARRVDPGRDGDRSGGSTPSGDGASPDATALRH